MTGENGPVLDGWQVMGRCCGELHALADIDCSTCQERLRPLDMPNVWDGDDG